MPGPVQRTIRRSVQQLDAPVGIQPLVTFRVLFGALALFAVVRFWALGWIDAQYVQPVFHFHYYGFSWVPHPGPVGIYGLFAVMGLGALGILLGAFARFSAALFFVAFTWVELLEAANYLNHYYLVSLLALLLVVLPAHHAGSLDVHWGRVKPRSQVPRWTLGLLRLQIGLVYVYAGLAKLNPDWLLQALPLRLWLPVHGHLPLVGPWFDSATLAYAFSWAGAVFDLSAPFLLLGGRTRPWAYAVVVVFHLLTWLLFPIGVFPWVMMANALVFFPARWHKGWQEKLGFRWQEPISTPEASRVPPNRGNGWRNTALALYVAWQLLWPARHQLYPGDAFWTEQGFRFGWRVMLVEKGGQATFYVTDPRTGRTGEAPHEHWLSPQQQKMMAFQPDLLLQMAHHLDREWQKQGIPDPVITARVFVTLNGRPSQLLVDPRVDLSREVDGFASKNWLLPGPR